MSVHPHFNQKVNPDPEPPQTDVAAWRQWRIRQLKKKVYGDNAVEQTNFVAAQPSAAFNTAQPIDEDQRDLEARREGWASWEQYRQTLDILGLPHDSQLRQDRFEEQRRQFGERERERQEREMERQRDAEQQHYVKSVHALRKKLRDHHTALGSLAAGEKYYCKRGLFTTESIESAFHRIQGEIRLIESELRSLGA